MSPFMIRFQSLTCWVGALFSTAVGVTIDCICADEYWADKACISIRGFRTGLCIANWWVYVGWIGKFGRGACGANVIGTGFMPEDFFASSIWAFKSSTSFARAIFSLDNLVACFWSSAIRLFLLSRLFAADFRLASSLRNRFSSSDSCLYPEAYLFSSWNVLRFGLLTLLSSDGSSKASFQPLALGLVPSNELELASSVDSASTLLSLWSSILISQTVILEPVANLIKEASLVYSNHSTVA